MDANRFDALTRSLTSTCSRRHLARLLRGLTLGSVVTARFADGDALAATCLAPKARCRRSGDCCSGRCKKRRGHHRGRCAGCGKEKVFCPAIPACSTTSYC